MRSQKSQACILIVSGLSFSIAAYLIQTYMDTWFPELFITGNWQTFRNDLSTILGYITILIGALVPAIFLVLRMRLKIWWNYLLLLGTLIGTTTLYYSYFDSVLMTPGNNISMPEWILAISPFIAAVAIATAIFGYFLVIREIFDHVASRPTQIILIGAVTASAILLTYQTGVALYAMIAALVLVKCMKWIPSGVMAVSIICLAIASEIAGSYFGAMGRDVGQYVPVWVFPLVFMALIALVPALRTLPKINPDLRNLFVFGVTWATVLLVALIGIVFSAGIFKQPDLLPQTLISIVVNCVLGAGIATILYYVLPAVLKFLRADDQNGTRDSYDNS
ncbi:hypothetical protein [Methanoregula sp.]|uniref:hypothetical protein n=1 Tax=Methanoregula sp. TaxID=2052170 RepID=UPI00236C27AC|nr:hypothetical protein [Methanoregula sp.]MDD1687015.1 hypothetical protein [Methanoregula sp.]